MAVGDLLQLPPVGDSPVYGSPRDPLQQLNLTLWEKHFYLLELTEVHRQRGYPQFAKILNRVRIGQQTEADIETYLHVYILTTQKISISLLPISR